MAVHLHCGFCAFLAWLAKGVLAPVFCVTLPAKASYDGSWLLRASEFRDEPIEL
jgi:hypothetical protein